MIQYLQYPNPAGLKRVKVDRYSRTVYDRIPEPPPRGPKGADRITILDDFDEHGRARRAKDFIKNKNIADKSSGLTFHYPPYAVGSYAEGEYVAFVPWETLKPYLEAEGTRIFGGARPKGDAGAGQ